MDDRTLLLLKNSLTGFCGNCGFRQFTGTYKITDAEYVKQILSEACPPGYPSNWFVSVFICTTTNETERLKEILLETGFEVLKEFRRCHNEGVATLWVATAHGEE